MNTIDHDVAPTFGDFTDALPDAAALNRFTDIIYEHYGSHGRAMPWRETDDPYAILVSEIMLQQTQVSRVLPKYDDFLTRWPTVEALAAASMRDVLSLWQGLGYNRRGRALHEIARIIVDRYNGRIPTDEEALLALPAVGPATASAIRSFAYHIPAVYLETNVRRVYLHFFFDGCIKVKDSQILPIAGAALDASDPRNWNYALMDYGVFIKEKLPNPNTRSATYTRQSRFEGSDRQIRGRILAHLVGTDSTADGLAGALPFEYPRILSCARALVSEGMICERDGEYFIPDSGATNSE